MADLSQRRRIRELDEKNNENLQRKKQLIDFQLQKISDNADKIGALKDIELKYIQPDPNQPRKTFKNLESLAQSIRKKGIMQPIIVMTSNNKQGCYNIIAGERRYRAAKMAGLFKIPCIIRHETDKNILILQLLENDQREKVSPFEEADALVNLIEK